MGCGGVAQRSQPAPEGNVAGGGSASVVSGGSDNEPDSGSAGRLGSSDGGDIQADSGVVSDSGIVSDSGSDNDAGSVPEHFWNDDTQHIEIACFGFFAGYATFRADRVQLSADQLALLANAQGVPGDKYDDNDDRIHCVVTRTDAAGQQRKFTIDQGRDSSLFAAEPRGDNNYLSTVLGCEFHAPWPGPYAFSANPLCLHDLLVPAGASSYDLDLPTPGKTYSVQLTQCAGRPIDQKLELFGGDPSTPIAIGVPPSSPGPDQVCLVLEAQVDMPIVGRLVLTPTSDWESLLLFR
jgi:hypothetical protein